MIARHADWEARLSRHLAETKSRAFEWGAFDCALAAADAIDTMTGVDLARQFRGRYRSALGAVRALRRAAGCKSLEAFVERVSGQYGLRETHPRLAQRGDMVLFDTEDEGPAIGVVDLTGERAVAVGFKGRVTIPLASCRRAWRVG